METRYILGALLAFIGAAASASIAIALYPLLRRYNEGLALGAVGFRLIEGVLYIVGAIVPPITIDIKPRICKSWSSEFIVFSNLRRLGSSRISLGGQCGVAAGFLPRVLCMYYYIFYQTKLVPRWLSGWGLVGATLCMVVSLLVMFGLIGPLSTAQVVLDLPIRRARNGSSGMADSERIQFICHRFPVCQKRSPTSTYSRLDASRRSYALGARPRLRTRRLPGAPRLCTTFSADTLEVERILKW